MKCYKCNTPLADDAKFCPLCGAKNDGTANFCSNCGKPVDPDSQFCAECGAPVKKIKKEEEKADLSTSASEIALEITEKVLEKMEGDTHSTHFDEISNARLSQAKTPAHSEMPAKPQSSTHDGSGGGAGQKIRRDAASVREAAIVKITLANGEVGYLPLINEGWGDWRIPLMDLATSLEGLG